MKDSCCVQSNVPEKFFSYYYYCCCCSNFVHGYFASTMCTILCLATSEGDGSPGTGATHCCEPPCRCWDLNSGPVEEHPVLSATEQPLGFHCYLAPVSQRAGRRAQPLALLCFCISEVCRLCNCLEAHRLADQPFVIQSGAFAPFVFLFNNW